MVSEGVWSAARQDFDDVGCGLKCGLGGRNTKDEGGIDH